MGAWKTIHRWHLGSLIYQSYYQTIESVHVVSRKALPDIFYFGYE